MVRYNKLLKFGTLLQQLKSFGLDPNQWEIQEYKSNENTIHFSNRFDPDFKIAGVFNGFGSAKPSWTKIYLTSI